jgi:hypothetical protein
MNSIERIEAMEAALNAAREATDQLSEAVAAQAVALDGLRALSGYYGSQDWYKDREADERGKLPENLARGVLGEDLPYEVLVDAREAALGALEVATAMLRAL